MAAVGEHISELRDLGVSDPGQHVGQIGGGVDVVDAFLTEDDWMQLGEESYEHQHRWDRWDYMFVGAAGVLASLADFLLVRIPRDMPDVSRFSRADGPLGDYATRGSPLTA